MSLLRSFSSDTPDSGFLLTTVLSAQNNYPIDGASVSIADESDPDTILEELQQILSVRHLIYLSQHRLLTTA